jgi:tripartite-type tricarboxylate transporter receptor subunit TctC
MRGCCVLKFTRLQPVRRAAFLVMTAAIVPQSALAQGYPNRPVRWVIPFSAGGAGDIPGRIVSQKLSEALGQQIVIDNRAGAGSTMGAEQVAKAPPDGYTFLMVSMTHFVSAALYNKLQYDPLSDFAPVTQMTSGPNVLLAHPSLPVKNVSELLALARSMPGKLNYASSGNGSFPHLNFALFLSMTGVQMTHIPYRGSGPAMADLLGGQVPLAFPGIGGVIPFVKAGKLRALAVSTAKRSAELRDVPTLAEAGVNGYEAAAWFGIAGPKGTPRDAVLKMSREIIRVLESPEIQQSLRAAGNEPTWQTSPENFGDFMKREAAKWADAVRVSGAKATE